MRLILFFFLTIFSILSAEVPRHTIILDPGHGGKDEGARIHNVLEKSLTLKTCQLVKKELEVLGYHVILTRARDVYLSLDRRVEIANQRPRALFVSIHYNSSPSPSAKGIEIYYYSKGEPKRAAHSKQLAQLVVKQLERTTNHPSRGVKRGNFHVIRQTQIPSILIEGGFLTNAEERTMLGTTPYLEKLAVGIAFGIEEFEKTVLGAS